MSTENTETVISINHVSKVYKLFEKPMDRLKESLSLTRIVSVRGRESVTPAFSNVAASEGETSVSAISAG